jgi:WD40 repeat protein
VSAVAFSPDGSLLASASANRTVRLWNPSTGREVQEFEQKQLIDSISFLIDNKIILTNQGAFHVDNKSISGNQYSSATTHNFPTMDTVMMNDSCIQ